MIEPPHPLPHETNELLSHAATPMKVRNSRKLGYSHAGTPLKVWNSRISWKSHARIPRERLEFQEIVEVSLAVAFWMWVSPEHSLNY